MIAGCAKRSLQGTMHMQNPRCTCRFMQPVYVLSDDHHLAFCFTLQSGKRVMCGVRLGLHGLRPPCVIEIMNELRIAREAFGCGHILDPVLGPQAPFIAKGAQTTLSGNSGSCQNNYLFHDSSLKRSAFNLRRQLKAERVQQLSGALHFAKICTSVFCETL